MLKKLLDMPNDSLGKTFGVAAVLCLAASILVSGAAVALRPMQASNKLIDMRRNILEIGGLYDAGKSVEEQFAQIDTQFIDLRTGEFVEGYDAESYDPRSAAKDPAASVKLAASEDQASIKRQASVMPVYLVKNGEDISRLILPVHGYGLWSTLYGFLALEPDTKTVIGLGFYEHAETPGLGGEVDNPNWKALWKGKEVYDQDFNVAISVIKGNVQASDPEAMHKVDGLAGATLTSAGVSNLMQFWLSDLGYGPFLTKFRDTRG
ncbi:MAG: Na(+)-translocating NADH-quinone reductase subunit C [Gammaproteobacteria bacterium]|nr:Na(+)-translocating NADH-quinone reductase subunit C [Gammaproteobacteria bacterium]